MDDGMLADDARSPSGLNRWRLRWLTLAQLDPVGPDEADGGAHLHRATDGAGLDRVLVVVEAHEAGLGQRDLVRHWFENNGRAPARRGSRRTEGAQTRLRLRREGAPVGREAGPRSPSGSDRWRLDGSPSNTSQIVLPPI
jgi:hypothetical protein